MKTVGEKIRFYREQKGLSQEDVADALDITVLAYSNIERNKTDISLSRLTQIAKYHKISIIDLLLTDDNTKTLQEENENLNKVLAEKNKEIIELQKQIIALLGENQSKKKK